MHTLTANIANLNTTTVFGHVKSINGLLVEITAPTSAMRLGARLIIHAKSLIMCEIIGFRENTALCLPFTSLEGISLNAKVEFIQNADSIRPAESWLGRVINAFGEPLDGGKNLEIGEKSYPLRIQPIPAHERERVTVPLDLGVRVLNTFTTCCVGQRMGIFAGSGVGKSVLMSMITKNTEADVIIIGLIGERGREVQEFLSEYLGEQGLSRAIIIVATSDEAPLMRRQAAYLTLTLSEYFRDQGKNVLCLMDSLTRFAMAQREIGLATGEPPTTKGYPPTTFSELPKLLERAGPGRKNSGSVTGLFTVLVEGDDHNEPIADAVRGILDGHIVMDRAIAERGRFPAVNVLRSISRTMPNCVPEHFRPILSYAREAMSVYADMEELIRLGAYRIGSDPKVDRAVALNPALEAYLSQGGNEHTSIFEGYIQLSNIMEAT